MIFIIVAICCTQRLNVGMIFFKWLINSVRANVSATFNKIKMELSQRNKSQDKSLFQQQSGGSTLMTELELRSLPYQDIQVFGSQVPVLHRSLQLPFLPRVIPAQGDLCSKQPAWPPTFIVNAGVPRDGRCFTHFQLSGSLLREPLLVTLQRYTSGKLEVCLRCTWLGE